MLFFCSSLIVRAEDPFKFNDNKIYLPLYKFKNKYVYSNQEKSKIDQENSVNYSTMAAPAIYTAPDIQIQISSIIGEFKSKQEFIDCLTKEGLFKKIVELKSQYHAWLEVDPSKANAVDSKIKSLSNIYKTLP